MTRPQEHTQEPAMSTITADIDTELAICDIHALRRYAEEIELGNDSTTITGEPIEWTRAG